MASVGITIKPADWGKQAEILRTLPAKIAQRVIKPALEDANRPVINPIAAAALWPSHGKGASKEYNLKDHTQNLARSITMKSGMRKDQSFIYCNVGPSHRKGPHGWLVEHGHRMVTGGSVARLGKETRIPLPRSTAPLEAKGKYYTLEIYKGTTSKVRKKWKALFRMLDKTGNTVDDLLANISYWRSRGYHPDETPYLVEDAVKTGGLYWRAHGERGRGKVMGKVPGYPFLKPVFEKHVSAIKARFFKFAERNSRRELAKLTGSKA